MRHTPLTELETRIKKLQALLQGQAVDGAVIVQNADLLYFAGTCQQAQLFVPADGKPVLMVKQDYERARRESALELVVPFESPKDLLGMLEAYGHRGFKRIGLELDVLPAAQYLRYIKLFAPAQVVDCSAAIRQVRSVKSAYELDIFKEAAQLNQMMFSAVPQLLREGMTELELAGKLEALYRSHGHQCHVRTRSFNMEISYGHLISGASLAVPSFVASPTGGEGIGPAYPQSAGFKVISKNEPIMVDYVGITDGYIIDQTRFFCIGSMPQKMLAAHREALEIQELLAAEGKPGVTCGELYELAIRKSEAGRYGANFMGFKNKTPFIGHGVGLELDELPVIARGVKTQLEPGMVLALEPKMLFPEGGVGVENTFVVTPQGLERLTLLDDEIVCV